MVNDREAWHAAVHRVATSRTEQQSPSHVRLFATPWTIACQSPLSMRFPRQEYWSGLSFPSPGNLPNPWIKLESSALQGDSLLSETLGKPHIYLLRSK